MTSQATLTGETLTSAEEVAAQIRYNVETQIRRGDLICMGRHRLLCGDSTYPDETEALFDGAAIDCLLSDPPYCSGGFQEAGRSAGSIGTRGDATIKNDMLSTRGYQSLIRNVIRSANCAALYLFTDWRMWVNLFDLVEACGYGVRSMIVWDKGSMGLGVGWRAQHELILHARLSSSAHLFERKYCAGNVIRQSRTGNKFHPTEKPVALLKEILRVTPNAGRIYDPFVGSGTTILACEDLGRECYAMEMSPVFCQVAVDRWERHTGRRAEIRGAR